MLILLPKKEYCPAKFPRHKGTCSFIYLDRVLQCDRNITYYECNDECYSHAFIFSNPIIGQSLVTVAQFVTNSMHSVGNRKLRKAIMMINRPGKYELGSLK